MSNEEDEREAKRKRQVKKMTKILSKSWQLDHSEPFQEVTDDQLKMMGEGPYDLTGMGISLDNGTYHLGRKGWELFASHLGGIYNRFISCGKFTKRARDHLKQVCDLLSKIEPNLADIASKSKPKIDDNTKKRKANDDNSTDIQVPKKKSAKSLDQRSSDVSSISQREEKAMQNLIKFITENGGNPELVSAYRCQVSKSGERYIPSFYSDNGKKFKSMIDVARFLGLIVDDSGGSNVSSLVNKGRPKNMKELEAERKKLKRELDRLMKNHEKATKSVDDFQNEKSKEVHQIDDELLPIDEEKNRGLWSVLTNPELDCFPGLPAICTQDVLMVWDFLCTFNRTLSLHPIELDDFVSSLIYKPNPNEIDPTPVPPVFLAEAHIALLRLLLNDQSSDNWWWSVLETPETEAQEETAKGEADNISPTIKIDFKALLDYEEDISVTKQWLQALEDVRSRRANAGGLIAAAVKTASSITTNPLVKLYLRRSMRGFQTYAAGFTKQSVMWLIGRVREARPDLWGRHIEPEILAAQKAKVVSDANIGMEQLDDEDMEIDNIEEMLFGESDEEDSDLDEDENDAPAERIAEVTRKKKDKDQDDSAPVTTSIPPKPAPSIIDLLLPPSKPHPSTFDILSPFTWPQILGATVSRILHRYKRFRNQVDDSLRDFRELEPLTVAERKKRESKFISRMFSECVAHSENDSISAVESAVQHLSEGNDYLQLDPVQRLCLLRIIVDAAYDTEHVYQCIQDNIKSRISAVKQLENEERRAKKEAKEASATLETKARERLAKEAKDDLISEKKRELLRKNKHTEEYSVELIESLEVHELIDLDEDFKAEFDALPQPKQFNKNEVRAMMTKIIEETAFNTTELEVLTLEEIESREDVTRIELEEELASLGNSDLSYNRDTSAKMAKLRSEIASFKEWQESLPPERAAAMEALKDAMEDGTIKPLRAAIRLAKNALLCGEDEETGGMWTLDILRDAQVELKQAEKRKRVIEAQKDLIAKRNKCFVRTESIGKDRYFNTYWHFDHDDESRIWFDAHYRIEDEDNHGWGPALESSLLEIGAPDEEDDLKFKDDENFIRFSRQEYHPSSTLASLVKRHTGSISSLNSLRKLIRNLDSKGVRENVLKAALKEAVESTAVKTSGKEEMASNASEQEGNEIQKSGDEVVFKQAKNHATSNPGLVDDIEMLSNVTSAIGRRCRIRHVEDDVSTPDEATYSMGTVIGWRIKKSMVEYFEPSSETTNMLEKEENVWTISLDKGGELELNAMDLLSSLVRVKKWRNQHPGYFEHDSPLFQYRNKIGRFCGRAADAPYAAGPFAFSKLMLKREQELYASLKSRSHENNWGGKDGIRNSWIVSMKENFESTNVLRNGLLSLEDAFYEMCGGREQEESKDEKISNRSASDILENDDLRIDVELESYGMKPKGLWNSYESRAVFREIISSSTSLGVLSLGLDLICRNAQAYLDATKSTSTRKALSNYELGLYNTSARSTRSAYATISEDYSSSSRRTQPQSYASFF